MNKNILITLTAILLVLIFFWLVVLREKQYTKTILVDGVAVEVAVYSLPKSLKIKPIYEPRDDLDFYPWLRTLLFQLNGFEMTIPKEEWPNYAEGDWPEERYKELIKYNQRMKKSIKDQSKLWNETYYEASEFVFCKIENIEYLSFCLTVKKSDGGTVGGSRYRRIKRVGGKWINPLENDENGRIRSRQVAESFDIATQLVAESKLKNRPEKELK